MKPVRFRWDVYGSVKGPRPWMIFTTWGRLERTLRAMTMPQERIRIEYENGQQVVVARRLKR